MVTHDVFNYLFAQMFNVSLFPLQTRFWAALYIFGRVNSNRETSFMFPQQECPVITKVLNIKPKVGPCHIEAM